jgi:putative salt-induced outer membrane protein YdiY
LENFYFQVAVPIGAEYIISDNNDIQWGVSGTIQPTYVIGDRAYVISSDYKNYAKFPDLMRRWNISTGIGTFVSYSTGRIKWQVGPHFRYQHLSSFVNALTVKEKLYAVGLKVGATLNNNKK